MRQFRTLNGRLHLEPNLVEAHYFLGMALVMKGRRAKAWPIGGKRCAKTRITSGTE